MSKNGEQDPNLWWSELNHGGMLLSPAILKEFLPNGPTQINPDESAYKKLRDAYTAFESWSEQEERTRDPNSGLYRWLDAIFDQFLDYPIPWWQKGNNVSDRFKIKTSTERLRPNRVLLEKGSKANPRFLIRIDTRKGRLGMGKGRVEYSKFLTLLRGTGVPFGIFTNGHQFRLIYVGMDYDCWVEWDAPRWFEAESGIDQLAGFVALCGKNATAKTDEDDFPLLTEVLKSRTRQGELSQVLGEQVRRAVEILLRDFDEAIQENPSLLESLTVNPVTKKEITDSERLDALYHASIRVIMRYVVILFAEARELLPKSMEKYHSSYGIEGLYAALEEALRHEGDIGLRESYSAWPRLLGLFRAIHEGCSTEDIPIPRYGGELFKRGDPQSADPVLRALAIFEDERWMLNDFVMLDILRLLKIGKVRARRGRASTWVSGPVDFSDLRTEYIGMMYEGVLDYGLKQVGEDEGAVVFLNVGQQPALPLSLLERLSDKELKDLVGKLKKEKTEAVSAEESEGEEETEETVSEEELQEELPDELESPEYEASSEIAQERPDDFDVRARKWAEKAVEIGKLLKKPSGKRANLYAYEQEKRKKANELLLQVYGPGEMYLVRASGTRKGTGTFYTRPQLAVPTVHRTLEPLAYDKNEDTGELKPKDPETILALKVVDPAMGSGSFLVAALRYLTEALYESLLYHKKIRERSSGGCVITLPFGAESEGGIQEEILPINPEDDRFEPLLKARLKRHVVERCIYGVDINPLAVELARLSLWVETMDRELPFEFLAHKVKVGDSLVGTWFDRFQEYPVMAWMREGGDKDHHGVYYEKGRWTKALKETLEKRVKPELVRRLHSTVPLEYEFGSEAKLSSLHEKAVRLFEELHALPIFGEGVQQREEFYRMMVANNPEFTRLRDAFDLWCAVWFWPGDWLDEDAPTPDRFYKPTETVLKRTRELADELRFFHWELEFPDVFVSAKGGFDAVLGNPPWENAQPNLQEFFSKYDPLFRTLGRMDSLDRCVALFRQDKLIERKWLIYNANFKSNANWIGNISDPFGVGLITDQSTFRGIAKTLIQKWKKQIESTSGYADPHHPYQLQKGRIFTYKLFIECGMRLLGQHGRLGLIIPSGIYTDAWSQPLRLYFIDKCRWEWLFGFENKKGIFNIHRSFKFCPIIIEKGGATDSIKTAFMRHDLSDWENPSPFLIPYTYNQVTRFSPHSKAILEIRTERDLDILEKIYSNSILLGDKSPDGWNIKYALEFMMNIAANLFPPRTWWEEKGYRSDAYGRWLPPEKQKPVLEYKGKEIGPPGDIALPLYEGRMIDQFDFSEKGWISGRGRSAIWNEIPFDDKKIEPQFLGPSNINIIGNHSSNIRLHFMRITSATNTRTMKSAVNNLVMGEANAPILYNDSPLKLIAILNSFVYDYAIRLRCGGLTLDYHIIEQSPIIPLNKMPNYIISLSLRLNGINPKFSLEWLKLVYLYPSVKEKSWKSQWAITDHERLRLRCILDAIVAELYGLDYEDLAWILRDCANPPDKLREISSKLDPKGFWRVDKGKPPELRQTTLTLLAFKRLKEVGIEAFCNEDWQFPDDIQERLGPRFLPWQLEGTPEGSWAECEQHAENILGEEGYREFIKNLNRSERSDNIEPITIEANNISKINRHGSEQGTILSWEGKE